MRRRVEAVTSLSWTEIKIWSEVRWRFRIKPRSTLEPCWCDANYS